MRTHAIITMTLLSAGTALGQCPFTPVGNVGFRSDSSVSAVSTDGNFAVGRAQTRSAEVEEAFQWTPGTTRDLGDLPGGISQSSAFAVSADGSIIVGRSFAQLDQRAFRWEHGIMTPLDDDPSILRSTAYGITADGLDAVGRALTDAGVEAVTWTDGIATKLPDLAGGPVDCTAFAISDDGTTIVGYATDATGTKPVRWVAGVPETLASLPGGSGEGVAYGASVDGSVIVGAAIGASGTQAFRWSGGVMIALGDLPGGAEFSVALDCSSDGSIIVGTSVTDNGPEAFIWDSINGMRNVRQFVIDTFGGAVTDPLGLNINSWHLSEAAGISGDGLRIVGTGSNFFDDQSGWLLDLNGGSGLFCPCDLDCDFQITALDALLYLGRWFPQNPSADTNGDTVVDVLDLLEFLTCFFAGRGQESCLD